MAFPTEATDVISNAALADEIPLGEGHVRAMRGGAREMAAEFRTARFAGDRESATVSFARRGGTYPGANVLNAAMMWR